MAILKDFPAPTEGVLHTEHNTTAFWENRELGKGTLYISESLLCWLTSDGKGFSLNYPSIFIHATSSDPASYPSPCLVLMIDGSITLEQENGDSKDISNDLNSMKIGEGDEEDSEEEEEQDPEQKSVEIRFVPDNRAMLNTMYQALSDCQALNPEPSNDESDDDQGCVMSPSFNIEYGDVNEGLEEEDDNYEEDMDEEQFEDAES